MSRPENARCKDCRWWEDKSEVLNITPDKWGECHFEPTAVATPGGYWCRHWEGKPVHSISSTLDLPTCPPPYP